MMRRLLLTAALLCGAVQAAPDNGLKGGQFTPARVAPEIAQKAADGSDFRLSALRGKVVVMAFGFTHCPAVCPVTLQTLADARKQLGKDAGQLQVVFVSVDPERDTAARMHAYVRQFDSAFVGLTGTPQQMADVRKDYGITATKQAMAGSKTDYLIGHSSYLYFIDKQGKLRSMLPFGRPAGDVAHDAALLARE
ncbi:MAG TPA: SCO family protein [Burkholderiaceae bacterium]